jgi:hypothetical protein
MSRPQTSWDRPPSAEPSGPEREPNLLHFGLRQWFAFVSAVVLFCGAIVLLNVAWALVFASAVALAVAHVLGTFLGTKLRDTSADVVVWKARPGSVDPDDPVALPQPVTLEQLELPGRTRLALRPQPSRQWLWALAGGGLAGWGLGAAVLDRVAGPNLGWPELALGGASCGVLGAWLALLLSNFWAIASDAWRDARNRD